MRAHYFQQSRVKQAVSVVKLQLNNDTAAFGALQELEELATMDLNVQESLQIWTISRMTETTIRWRIEDFFISGYESLEELLAICGGSMMICEKPNAIEDGDENWTLSTPEVPKHGNLYLYFRIGRIIDSISRICVCANVPSLKYKI